MTLVLPALTSAPPPREDAPAVLAHVLAVLKATVVGDDGGPLERALARLAVQATAWYCLELPWRTLLAGPTGSGKSLIARTIAASLGVPMVRFCVTDMAEATWSGPQLSDTLRALCGGVSSFAAQTDGVTITVRDVAPRGILVLDEICKLSLASYGDHRHERESASWRRGRQETLLPLLDPEGVVTAVAAKDAVPLRIETHKLAVLSTGAFAMLPTGHPITSRTLTEVGFLPELADRVGSVVSLPGVDARVRTHLVQVRQSAYDALARALGVPDALVALSDAASSLDIESFAGPRSLAHAVEGIACDRIVRALLP
ncbi:MAG: AAA family ATPase [Gemmatimonadaceae bacterium]|nr:AAA family ATPase [Gemmatimonadaceae bacterium]